MLSQPLCCSEASSSPLGCSLTGSVSLLQLSNFTTTQYKDLWKVHSRYMGLHIALYLTHALLDDCHFTWHCPKYVAGPVQHIASGGGKRFAPCLMRHAMLQEYVNGFAHCLMLCNGDEASPAYPRLLQLLAETRALKLTFCMLRPVRFLRAPASETREIGPIP